MKLRVLRADPAGNITLFVLDPVEREQRPQVAARLMAMPALHADQVGFLCPPAAGGDGRLEMMGGEFCGNATRALGLLMAKNRGDVTSVRLEVSGCHHLVTVDTDPAAGTARAEMPLPLEVRRETVDGHEGTLVNLGGIVHLVTEDAAPAMEFFQKAEPLLKSVPGPEAYGVIFLDREKDAMTPLVKVPATDTLVWEGSCGSGSLAAAVAQSQGAPDGVFQRCYRQPAGVIEATVVREDGKVTAAYIGGPVSLEEPVTLQL